MKLLSDLLSKPITAFKDLDYVFHYHKPANVTAPYAVWIEQNDDDFHADDDRAERCLEGIIDFYTQTEGDVKVDAIETALQSMSASWSLTGVQYEEDTALIHYSWDWSVH